MNKVQEKTVNITNFIGVYDGYITKEECNKVIQLFGKIKLKDYIENVVKNS